MYTYNKYCTRKSEAIKKPLNGKTKGTTRKDFKNIYIKVSGGSQTSQQ